MSHHHNQQVSSPLSRPQIGQENDSSTQRKRLTRALRANGVNISKAQQQFTPELAPDHMPLPEKAYVVMAEPVTAKITYEQLEKHIWQYACGHAFPFAITKHVIQQNRHLIALSHLRTAQELFIHRNIIEAMTRWRLSPLRPRVPCIRCSNVPLGLSNEDLLSSFFSMDNEDIRIHDDTWEEIKILRYRGDTLVLQITPALWRSIRSNPKVHFQHRLAVAVEHFQVLQCFKCTGYGHTAARCDKADNTCLYCAQPHTTLGCPTRQNSQPPKCAVCIREPQHGTMPQHMATDYAKCPAAQQRQQARQNQTIYDEVTYRTLLHLWLLSQQQPESAPNPPTTTQTSTHRPAPAQPHPTTPRRKMPAIRPPPPTKQQTTPPPLKIATATTKQQTTIITAPLQHKTLKQVRSPLLLSLPPAELPLNSIFSGYGTDSATRRETDATEARDPTPPPTSPDREAASEKSNSD